MPTRTPTRWRDPTATRRTIRVVRGELSPRRRAAEQEQEQSVARTRTTIRRVDPWSILKFGFVANLVLLGIQLLAGLVIWYVIQRLELIQTVCELAASVGFEECGVDGGALFDTVLVLGLLGVVIQTGILVFLTFLANLIFDLTGGIGITLDTEQTSRGPSSGQRGGRGGVGTRASGAGALARGRGADTGRSSDSSTGSGSSSGAGTTSGGQPARSGSGRGSGDDDTLFG